MDKEKKFTTDVETLKDQLDKLDDMLNGDKKAIAENEAIALDPNHILDSQGEMAEARINGTREGMNRHEKMREETTDRLNKQESRSNQVHQDEDLVT